MKGKVFLGQSLIWTMILLGHIQGYRRCIVKEKKALLELKTYLDSQGMLEGSLDAILPTWTNDTKSDCCWWEGVECNRTTRRVIMISFGGLYTIEDSLLKLSLLHPFEDLRSLDLSESGFIGLFDDVEGYKSLRRLRNLEILDFSFNRFNNSIFPFLNAATSLKSLILRGNNMDGSFPVKELKDLTNLELLDLSGNGFNGSIPIRELFSLKKLKALDLSSNEFSDSMELQELKNLTHLEVLGLAWNSFRGPIPIEVFCEMKNIQELDLRGILLESQVPRCLGSLNKLRVLDHESTKISGDIPSSFSGLKSLEYLSLSYNNFTGLFSLNPLANLTKLKVLKLSSTSDMIQVEAKSTWQPKFQLSVVELPFCSLESIPNFLTYQKNLRLVDLSSNRLSGHIPSWLLENNLELEVLRLENNSFTIFKMPTSVHTLQFLDFSANDISGVFPDNIGHALPNMKHLNGSDNMFRGDFPSSMGEMKNISFLDMSYNNFSGELPRSIVTNCFSLQVLKLSHNNFRGHFLTRRTKLTSLSVLNINNNSFTGKIGVGLRSSTELSLLDMSNNRFTGAIPSWISNFSQLEFLLISNNFLEGVVPPSLLLDGYFSFLDLSGNLLSGALPSHVRSFGNKGKMLFLQNNNFTGSIPDTLLESNVMMLDLRNNKLSGSIPQFENANDIKILLLRGNNLTGSIPRQLCDLSNIRILDLSDNKLDGFIPSCLSNLSFGREGGEDERYSYYGGSPWKFSLEFYKSTFVSEEFLLSYFTVLETKIKFATKQRYDSYNGLSDFSDGTLDYMYGLDLSSNKLSGVIPTELGDLSKLRAMNLSRNFLLSSIPDSFSKLKDIESLDISFNMLYGSIPQQLTNLTSLSFLNVSYNNLSGIIPQGRQFNTFNDNNYLENPLLCGLPTNRSCEAKKDSEEAKNGGEEEDDNEGAIDMLVFYWTIGSTYVIVLIGSLVFMSFDCPWRRALLRLVDAFFISAENLLS